MKTAFVHTNICHEGNGGESVGELTRDLECLLDKASPDLPIKIRQGTEISPYECPSEKVSLQFKLLSMQTYIQAMPELDVTNVDELQVNNSSHTKGTICLVNGGEWAPKGWFFKYGCTNGCHKTLNGWYLGLVAPISSIVGLPILYT